MKLLRTYRAYKQFLKALLFFTLYIHEASSHENFSSHVPHWKDKMWKKLMHESPSMFSSESEVDSKNFFLTKDGSTNFRAEYEMLLKLISQGEIASNDKDPLCRFPARIKWIAQKNNIKLSFDYFKNCNAYQTFLKLIPGDTIILVFSSYYLESPGSAFGHTLLRIKDRSWTPLKELQENKLLDMGINYSAQVTTSNAVLYALFGLTGVFQGHYVALPYFYKVREYNDFESRDLWNYELDLNKEQVHRLKDHLWEVGQTFSYYYYLKENCSYNLLRLLEVAHGKIELINKLPRGYAIPGHTIQIVYQQTGLVKNINVDPSMKRVFEQHFFKLSKKEQRIVLDSYHKKNIPQLDGLTHSRKAYILDALIYFIDYKYPKKSLLLEGKIGKWKKKILTYRSQLPEQGITSPPQVSQNHAPHLGHGPRRSGVEIRSTEEQYSLGLNYRFAMHDTLDPSMGHPDLAVLEMMDISMQLDEQRQVLDKLDIIEVLTLNPWTSYARPLGFYAKSGFLQENFYCKRCSSYNTELAGGITPYYDGIFTFYLFLKLRSSFAKEFKHEHLWRYGPYLGIRYRARNNFTFQITADYQLSEGSIRDTKNITLESRFASKNDHSFYINLLLNQYQGPSIKLGQYFYF